MADYWKSQPKKFCDFCKCWIADNKPSIDFHEKGQKHQDNVKRRISEIGRKGQKQWKEQQKLDKEMALIESKALLAFQKDLADNEALASHYRSCLEGLPDPSAGTASSASNYSGKAKQQEEPKKKKKINLEEQEADVREWFEAISDDSKSFAKTYYWNIKTKESQWEPPSVPYVSMAEQQAPQVAEENMDIKQQKRLIKKKVMETKRKLKEAEKQKQAEEEKYGIDNKVQPKEDLPKPSAPPKPSTFIGPSVRPNPYGDWVPVPAKKKTVIDLQLPKKKEEEVYVPEYLEEEEEEFVFTERTVADVGGVQGSGDVTFKKRRFGGIRGRNVRKRGDDD